MSATTGQSSSGAAATRPLRLVPAEGERSPRSCEAADGSRAAIEADGEGAERLVVRDREGGLLFEYDPAASRCVVHVPRGDLVLRAEAGAIELDAERGLRLRGGEAIDLQADRLRAASTTAEVDVEELLLRGGSLTSTFRRVRQRIDVLETTAGRVVERAKETYRDVENLAQLRAGRIRQVAEKTFHVLGTRTLLKASKDLKLKGTTIHLG